MIKRLMIALLLCITGVVGYSQVVVADPSLVDKKISDFSKTLDSVAVTTIRKQTIGATIFVVDTLRTPLSTSALYNISVTATNVSTGEVAWGQRSVLIKNSKGGSYALPTGSTRSLDGAGMNGEGTIAKISWAVAIVNNLAIVRIAGIANLTVNWIITEKPVL